MEKTRGGNIEKTMDNIAQLFLVGV